MKPLEEPDMVLKFKCACGQTITAKAEYVGRRVQCVGCKKILLVPGAERKPAPKPEPEPILAPPVYTPEPDPLLTMTPPAPPVLDLPQITEEFRPEQLELPPAEIPMVAEPVATMMPTHDVLEDAVAEPPPEEEDILDADVADEPMRPTVRTPALPPPSNDGVIRFRCACGATFQAARVHAGEPTRCARCSDVLFIPTRTQALKADGRPLQVSFAPTERGRKESSRKGLAVALVLLWLVVIGGGGYAYWEFYGRTTIEQETGKGGVSVRTAGIPGGGAGMMQMQPGGPGGAGGAGGAGGGRPGGAQGQQGGRPGGAQGQQGGRPGGALGQQGGPPPQARQVQIVKDGENAALKPLDLIPATAMGFASIRLAEALAEPDIKKSLENPLFKDGLAQLEFAEMMLGSKLEDVERVIVVAPQADPMEAWGIIQVKKPFQREKLLTAAQMPAPQFVGAGQKKRAYYVVNNAVGLHFVNDNVLVAGPKAGVEAYLNMGEPAKQGPLAAALKEADGKRQLVVAAHVPDDLRKEWLEHAPPALGPFKDFLAIKSVQWVSDFRVAASMTLEAVYVDADKAKAVKPALEGLIKQARDVAKPPLVSADLQKLIGVYFDGVSVTQKDALVKVDVKELDAKTAALLQEELRKLQEEATKKVREAAARTVTMNNFKQLAIAVHNYASVYNQLPPAIIAKDGKPLFSWRVALLPYVEQDNLYKQLKLDEPWNSEHNKKVLERVPMPKVFEVDGVQAPANTTHIQLFTGKDTVFPGQGKVGFQDITDGSSNTILFIEAAKPVHWAEPTGDIAYSANVNPLTQIRKRPAGCLAALCDGSVRMLSPQLTEKTLRNLIMPADGNVVNIDE